ncbi:MAG TPA: YtxH domain-containing protein [Bryobacteraceae bacterium]|nr:YtxH domain-containing protein [Bryobacteraceae bacterium]
MREDNSGKFACFFAGAAIGAAIALLYAPDSGERTRQLIGESASRGKEKLNESGRDLVDRGLELFERGRQIADEASELFESGRKLVQG